MDPNRSDEIKKREEELYYFINNFKLILDNLSRNVDLLSTIEQGLVKDKPIDDMSKPESPTSDASKPCKPKTFTATQKHNDNPAVRERAVRLAQMPIAPTQANQALDQHSMMLHQEFHWLKTVLSARIDSYFESLHVRLIDFVPPLINKQSYYGAFIEHYKLNSQQRLVVIMALTIELWPNFFDLLQCKNELYDLPFSEFGGIYHQSHVGFTPTIQTALYIMAGGDTQQYIDARVNFTPESKLFVDEILAFLPLKDDQCLMDAQLRLTSNCRDLILFGHENNPQYSADFPAKELTTHLEWSSLVLMEDTHSHLHELTLWLKYNKVLIADWGTSQEEAGYKVLFYGPPGTGKTLTANLLAKKLNRPIYRVDLSQIVSKYIGETEKNLEKIFLRAERKDWILFFDEADSLFSKRSSVNNSNDRHANQETAYLLQRIEGCKNLVILASNLKDNIDEAFLRRFQSIIHFPKPDVEQREKLWHKGFSAKADISKIDISELAEKYDLTGAEINNIIRFASLKAIDRGGSLIQKDDIITAIRREKFKEGKFL